MSSEAQLATVYAQDEDLAVMVYGDFAALAPKDAVLAQGTDGVFASGDLWTLTSATNDFGAQGVKVGHILSISGPAPFKGNANLFAIGAVSGHSVTLRRYGKGDGIGLPPSPAGGLTGVTFILRTFDAQIEDASYEINQVFGIDPAWPQSAPNLVYDLRALRRYTALTVITRAYAGDSRTKDGDFAKKVGDFRQQLSAARSIVQLRWNQATDTPPPSSLFSTRTTR